MSRLRLLWYRLRSTLWFIPSLVLLASLALALGLVEADLRLGSTPQERWPRLLDVSADAARDVLSAIATSMITVAGVVFSTTIVALSLAASQYSPRVLGSFSNDRFTQCVLGVFVGVFAYSLVVLRTVRGADAGDFVPVLAVAGAVVYALLAVLLLVFFIHHISVRLQASTIIEHIAVDAGLAIERWYPDCVAEPAACGASDVAGQPGGWALGCVAQRDGYVRHVATDMLLQCAVESERVVRLTVRIGDFVARGAPLAMVSGAAAGNASLARSLHRGIELGRQRTVEQDPAYGLQQLADVAVKALSPGINDPTTATLCVDRAGALLARLAGRPLPEPCRAVNGTLRLVAPGQDFATLVGAGLAPIVRHSRGDLLVLPAVLTAVRLIAHGESDPARLRCLAGLVRDVRRELLAAEPQARSARERRDARILERALLRRAGVPPQALRARMLLKE